MRHVLPRFVLSAQTGAVQKKVEELTYIPVMEACQVNFCLLPGDVSDVMKPLPECTCKATGKYDALIDGFAE